MEDLPLKGESQQAATTPPFGSQSVALPDEALELIEYRMWNKFQVRLWAIVGCFLALISIGGYLGVRTYIERRVGIELQEERRKFATQLNDLAVRRVKALDDLTKSNSTFLVRAEITNHIFHKWREDQLTFSRLVETARQEIKERFSGDKHQALRNHLGIQLESMVNLQVRASGFENSYRSIEGALISLEESPPDADAALSRNIGSWTSFVASCNENHLYHLPETLEMYVHLIALGKVLEHAHATTLSSVIEDKALKFVLEEEYNAITSPVYQNAWADFGLPNKPNNTNEFRWSHLPLSAETAFSREKRIVDGSK